MEDFSARTQDRARELEDMDRVNICNEYLSVYVPSKCKPGLLSAQLSTAAVIQAHLKAQVVARHS